MVLSQYEKEANASWWKMIIKNCREGGSVVWADKGHHYIMRGSTLIAPNMRAYRDMMKNTTQEFFCNYVKGPEWTF